MKDRLTFLPMTDLMRLNDACIRIREAFGYPPYLVGSVTEGPDFRDVDVRTVMDDAQFDALFEGREFLWSLLCLTTSEYLRVTTGLPVDYQVQRRSVAQEKFSGKTTLVLGVSARLYAGGGDAT